MTPPPHAAATGPAEVGGDFQAFPKERVRRKCVAELTLAALPPLPARARADPAGAHKDTFASDKVMAVRATPPIPRSDNPGER